MTLINVPPSHLATERLAGSLAARGRAVLWVSVGPEDRDPATLLLSLIAAQERLWPDGGRATLLEMRRRPGPQFGWPRIFALFAEELARSQPGLGAIALDQAHHLGRAHSTFGLLCTHFLPALGPRVAFVLTTEEPLPRSKLPSRTVCFGARDLRISLEQAFDMAEQTEAALPASSIRRALALTDGGSVPLSGLFAASNALGPALAQQAVAQARGTDDLLGRLARAWLDTIDRDGLPILALAVRLEYCDRALVQAALGVNALPAGPWVQPLQEEWVRVRRAWQAPLRAVLRGRAVLERDALRRAAGHLAERGATEQAVSLYFEVDDPAGAASVIALRAEEMADVGQWGTLDLWLSRLPGSVLHDWPSLVHVGAEIAVARGQARGARNAFAAAAAMFTACGDVPGACQSLLAAGALSAWQGDFHYAHGRVVAANAMAVAAGLSRQRFWSACQLGHLLASAGDLSEAVAHFSQAAALEVTADEGVGLDWLRGARTQTLRVLELRREREMHHQACLAAGRAEAEAEAELRTLLTRPVGGLDTVLGLLGWSHTPLIVKVPGLRAEEGPKRRPGFWSRVRKALRLHSTVASADHLAHVLPGPCDEPAEAGGHATLEAATRETVSPQASAAASPGERPSEAAACLLGTFRFAVDGRVVESWPTGKGRAVFKYLLAHHDQPAPRDVLMDVFWRQARPDAARNSLNVALHGLRRALRAVTEAPVVVFEGGAYRLGAGIDLRLDVDAFERHLRAARGLEADGRPAAAAPEYEAAALVYAGDFMQDDPYEDWPVLTRERLRLGYLDALDRVSQIYFSQGRYASCAKLCHLILDRDACREDAHSRLMRCYSREGQRHLALRQYEACVGALRAELDVEPAPATSQLHESIRRREPV